MNVRKAKRKWGGQAVKAAAKIDCVPLEFIFTQLTACGLKKPQIADIIGIDRMRLFRWCKKYPELEQAIDEGKKVARAYLIARGMRAAAGYEYTEEKIQYRTKKDKEGNRVEYISGRAVYKRHQPANPTVLLAMLWNLDRQLGGKDWLMRPADTVKKIGGDKNVFILEGRVTADKIDQLASKLLEQMETKRVEANELSKDSDANAVSLNNTDRGEGEPAVAQTALQTAGSGLGIEKRVS